MPKFAVGERVLGVFSESVLDGVVVKTDFVPDQYGRTVEVRYDEIPSRTYMMAEDELTSIEELFG